MAQIFMEMTLDDGSRFFVEKTSQRETAAIFGGGPALMLAQEAYVTLARALGMTITSADVDAEAAGTPDDTTTDDTKESTDGAAGDGSPVEPGDGGAPAVPAGPRNPPRRPR